MSTVMGKEFAFMQMNRNYNEDDCDLEYLHSFLHFQRPCRLDVSYLFIRLDFVV